MSDLPQAEGAQPAFSGLSGSASDLRRRLAARLEAVGRAQKAIPGEPCGGMLYHCKNPRHSEYFNLTVEREKLRDMMARAQRLPNAECSQPGESLKRNGGRDTGLADTTC